MQNIIYFISYEKLQELSLAFYDRFQTGALMARVNQDTRELMHFLVDFIPLTLESIFILIGGGVFLFVLSWQLTLFVFIPIVATAIFLKKVFFKIYLYYSLTVQILLINWNLSFRYWQKYRFRV